MRGPNVVAGYWGDPARTAETFVDGWLHTGDVAAITDGMVRIVDRAKDMINRGGENVYSVEVENVLAEHPDVLEVAVVGVADPVMGEKVGAVVLPREGAEDLVPSLIAFARERLADYKVPQFVRVIDDGLPRNAGGKVLKTTLRGAEGWIAVPRALADAPSAGCRRRHARTRRAADYKSHSGGWSSRRRRCEVVVEHRAEQRLVRGGVREQRHRRAQLLRVDRPDDCTGSSTSSSVSARAHSTSRGPSTGWAR